MKIEISIGDFTQYVGEAAALKVRLDTLLSLVEGRLTPVEQHTLELVRESSRLAEDAWLAMMRNVRCVG